jgi:hypothetical protein
MVLILIHKQNIMKKFIAVTLMIFVAFLPEILLAHPGHGGHEGGYTIIHYFIEPMHAVVTIGCMVAVLLFVRYGRNKVQK